MNDAHLLGYVAAGGLLIMAPGPDFAVVLRNGVAGGRAAASAAGLGVSTGFLVWSIAVATGLATILAASAAAYTTIKLAGVAYLIVLGLMSLSSALRRTSPQETGADSRIPPRRFLTPYREGLLTNVLNPKVAVTFLSLMPQFLPPRPPVSQLAVLSIVTVVIATVWFQFVAVLVGELKHAVTTPSVRRTLDAITGAVLVAFGVRLASEP